MGLFVSSAVIVRVLGVVFVLGLVVGLMVAYAV